MDDAKRGTFIVNEFGKIIFYTGILHELNDTRFDPSTIIGENLVNIFDYDIVSLLSKRIKYGYFNFKNEQYSYNRRVINISDNLSLIYLEIEWESDENLPFYSMVIHEIKNPLTAVRSLIQALSLHVLDEEKNQDSFSTNFFDIAKDYFNRIISEVDRLNRLLNSVKYITKHIQPLYIPLDLIKVANNTIKIFEHVLKEKEIILTTNFEAKTLMFYGDPDQFQQIFNNLLSNSIEAIGDSKGNIEFTIKKIDNSIQIELKDAGKGIDKNDLEKIFKAFYTKKLGGMGIGLKVIRMIVKTYKGDVNIQSSLGEGTIVSIILPFEKKI